MCRCAIRWTMIHVLLLLLTTLQTKTEWGQRKDKTETTNTSHHRKKRHNSIVSIASSYSPGSFIVALLLCLITSIFSLFLIINLYTFFLTVFFLFSFPGHFYLLCLLIPYFNYQAHIIDETKGADVLSFLSLDFSHLLLQSSHVKTNVSPSAYGHSLSPNQNSKLVCALQLFEFTYSGLQHICFSLLPGIIFTFWFFI